MRVGLFISFIFDLTTLLSLQLPGVGFLVYLDFWVLVLCVFFNLSNHTHDIPLSKLQEVRSPRRSITTI